MKKLIWLLLCSVAFGQTTTTVTGILKDLTGATVTSGKVTYTLTPSRDTTISGLARFTSQIVTCPIASTGDIVSLANSNVTTTVGTTNPGTSVVVTSATGWALGQSILIVGAGAASANYIGTVSNIAGTTFTITPATTTSVNAGTKVYDPCQMTMNTALNPPGTYYVVKEWPANVPTATFTFYAVNSTYDLSTVVPTPTTAPAQNFVDIFSNQTIAGNKIFSGSNTYSGTSLFTNPVSFTGGGLITVLNTLGDAGFNITSQFGGHSSTTKIAAVTTNGNNGEMQFQIGDANPFGWRFCATNGGAFCPLLIKGDGSHLTFSNNADAIFDINAVGGTNTTSQIVAVVSNGNVGEVQFKLLDANAKFWRFNATGNNGVVAQLSAKAPLNSVVLNDDGTLSVPNALKTNTAGNTDQAGTCTLGTNCSPARTFAATYVSAPICTCADTTAANACRVQATTGTLTLTGTGTDVLDYVCVPRN